MMAVTGAQIVTLAEKFRGVPYVWGGTSPSGFDCSGLVKYVLSTLGVRGVPRTSEDQWNWVDKVPPDQVQAGDLVFFAGSDGTSTSPGHVGIVVAPGTAQHGPEMIDAPYTGVDVRVEGFDPGGSGVGQVVGYGRAPSTSTSGATGTGGGGGGGILSWPSDITGFFSDADHALGTASAIALAFFQPSTYIRIAVGALAVILLVTGLLFLIRAAAASDAG